ncbi:hypothetical protein OHC33_001129 [Knufia fluminis]|uniref:BTB domain-containing protein n=1 Tax=Knufia fluminis TaxID=191047 RepID=A0AAN8EKR9_9EURO|nr:hypothetical protein OHC33_001129 [Knufia fluminis]
MDLYSVDFSSTVTIVLEDIGARFIVYKDLLCDKIPFARAYLQNGFKEEQEGVIRIREWSDKDIMQRLLVWLFEDKIVTGQNTTISDLTKLYILADRLMISDLKTEIVNRWSKDHEGNSSDAVQALTILTDHEAIMCNLARYAIDDIAVSMERQLRFNHHQRYPRMPLELEEQAIGEICPEFRWDNSNNLAMLSSE